MQTSAFVTPKNNQVSGGVNFVLQYSVKAFVLPQQIDDQVKFTQTTTQLSLTNIGNSFNSVSNLYRCPTNISAEQVSFDYQNEHYSDIEKQLDCKKLSGAAFIYPKQTIRYSLPINQNLVVIMYNKGKHEAKVFHYHHS